MYQSINTFDMKKQILQEALDLLRSLPDVTETEYYYLLASFLVYFQTPFKSEEWNTFPRRLEQKEWTVQRGLFSTDEEKNPEFWGNPRLSGRARKETQTRLFDGLRGLVPRVRKSYPFPTSTQTPPAMPEALVVSVPDATHPTAEPTLFPVHYLQQQLQKGVYVNELTGLPFSWTFVDQFRRGVCPTVSVRKSIPAEDFLQQIQNELTALKKNRSCCAVCQTKTNRFKSIRDYQTFYFCSLDCIRKWPVGN
jgi:hypothetical protein